MTLSLAVVNALAISNSNTKETQYSVPFQGMTLAYYSETTPALYQQTGLAANGWIMLMFHDLTGSSSKLDISINGNITQNGQQTPVTLQTTTVDFPTNEDTILFLRNGDQQNLQIYAGPAGQALQLIPGYSFEFSGSWDLHDQPILRTSLGTFAAYRYHNSLTAAGTTLDVYASYDQGTQVLVYGEVYANRGGASALIEKIELRATNLQFTTTTSTTPAGSSPRCVIATAAYGSDLAPPVQFLREFRDRKVEQTYVGSRFMSAFNAWYYSWAPMIAKAESNNRHLRTAIRFLMIPLLGSLYVSEKIFDAIAPVNPEFATLLGGIIATALLGLFYITPILFVPLMRSARLRSMSARNVAILLTVGAMLTLVGTITHGTFGIAENLTSLGVIETILLVPVGFLHELGKTIFREKNHINSA